MEQDGIRLVPRAALETMPGAVQSTKDTATAQTLWLSSTSDSRGFNPSTVDVVIIVVGMVVIAIFLFGLCYSCVRLMTKRRQSSSPRRRERRVQPAPSPDMPFTPHQGATAPPLPTYSAPPVFPDEPPPQYSTAISESPPAWGATNQPRALARAK